MKKLLSRSILVVAASLALGAASPVMAALGWVGNMWPTGGSYSTITEGNPFTVYVQVWKSGVTDQPGQGADITCTLHWGQVTTFGGPWSNTTDTPMTYNTDIGNNDEYMATISPAAGLYEFTAFCTDTTDGAVSWQQDGNGHLTVNQATAVVLTSFSAQAQDGGTILLRWETASELDNLGFNLYRAAAVGEIGAERVQLNDTLIRAAHPGSPLGASYEFNDETVRPGMTYLYWLEDVDIYGAATLHGPISVRLEPVRRLLPLRPRLAPFAPVQVHR